MSEDTLIPVLQECIDLRTKFEAVRTRYKQLKKRILNLAPENNEQSYVLLKHNNIVCKLTKEKQYIWNADKLTTACNLIGYETFKTLFDIDFYVKSEDNINYLLSNQSVNEQFKQILRQSVIKQTKQSIDVQCIKHIESVPEQPLPDSFTSLIVEACPLHNKIYGITKRRAEVKAKADELLSKASSIWHSGNDCSVVYDKFVCTKKVRTHLTCDRNLTYALFAITDRTVFNNMFAYKFHQKQQRIKDWLADWTISNEHKNLLLDAVEGIDNHYGLTFMTVTDID